MVILLEHLMIIGKMYDISFCALGVIWYKSKFIDRFFKLPFSNKACVRSKKRTH